MELLADPAALFAGPEPQRAGRQTSLYGFVVRVHSHFRLDFAETPHGEPQVYACMGGRDLGADAGFAVRHHREGKSDHIDAFSQHPRGEIDRLGRVVKHDRVEAAIAANAGRYTLPLLDEAYPYGVKGIQVTEDGIAALLRYPLQLLVGDKDLATEGSGFPTSPDAVRQGPTRLARALNYYRTGEGVARGLGTTFAWKLTVIPDVAQEGGRMSAVAGPILEFLGST